MTMSMVRKNASPAEILGTAIAYEHEAETMSGIGLYKSAAILLGRAQRLRADAKAALVKLGVQGE